MELSASMIVCRQRIRFHPYSSTRIHNKKTNCHKSLIMINFGDMYCSTFNLWLFLMNKEVISRLLYFRENYFIKKVQFNCL
jgi:hypothetical protein